MPSISPRCGRVEQAFGSLAAAPDARRAMKLKAALRARLMYTRGVTDPEVAKAWGTALDLAERLGDADYQLRALLGVLLLYALRSAGGRRGYVPIRTSIAEQISGNC